MTPNALPGFDRSSESLPGECAFEFSDHVEDAGAGDERKRLTHQLDQVLLAGAVTHGDLGEPCSLRAAGGASNESDDQIRGHVAERVDIEALRDDRGEAITHRLRIGAQPRHELRLGSDEFSLQRAEFCFLGIESSPLDERFAQRGEGGLEPGDAGWMAFAMQFYDHHWNDRWGQRIRERGNVMVAPGSPPATVFAELQAPPSFYMKRQAKATFMWDPLAIRNRDLTGLDCLLWGNDYPHWEGSFPDSQQWVEKQFAGVPEDEIDQMVRRNAAETFGLGTPSATSREL